METANLFWDNQPLKNLNHLCIRSLIDRNFKVTIFSYKPELFNDYKDEVSIFNANEILDEKFKFYYKGNGDCTYKCVVGFSDIFRYALLYKTGGWYFDFDTIVLRNFSEDLKQRDTVIRPNFKYHAVSNICKFKKNDSFLDEIFYETKSQVTEDNNRWCLPLEIFYDKVVKFNLCDKIVPVSYFSDDNTEFLRDILYKKITDLDLSSYYALHICNTFFRSGHWFPDFLYNTNLPKNMTLLHFLYKKYQIL